MLEAIQPLLAPVIMVSAGALIAIAQFGRYTAIVNLIRALNRERLAYFQQMKQANPELRSMIKQHTNGLEQQVNKVLSHAVMVKNALSFLIGGILLMLLSSLAIGASLVFNSLEMVPLILFVGGLVSMLISLGLLLAELRVSLDALAFEHENLNRFRSGEGLLPPALRDQD
jgi:hypothetical protein